jgi:hypothetical protein
MRACASRYDSSAFSLIFPNKVKLHIFNIVHKI